MSQQAAAIHQRVTTEVYTFLDTVKEYHEKGIPLPEEVAANAISRIRAADKVAIRYDSLLSKAL